MLNAIGTFQDKLDMQILEWSESNQRLYIIEPSFLFYLRWREEKSHQPSIYEFLSSLLDSKVGVFFKEVKPVGMGILSSAISSSKTLITDDSTNDEGEPDN